MGVSSSHFAATIVGSAHLNFTDLNNLAIARRALGKIDRLQLARVLRALTVFYRHDATNNLVYWCNSTTGVLNRYNVTTSSNTTYAWPITRMRCTGYSLVYSATRNSLIFPFQQDGQGGIAEYLNP